VRRSHLRLFVILAYHTAARRGAILELTWDRVDLDHRRIAYQKPGRRETEETPRRVPINPIAFAALGEAREVARVSDYVIEYHAKPIRSVKTRLRPGLRDGGDQGLLGARPAPLRGNASGHGRRPR